MKTGQGGIVVVANIFDGWKKRATTTEFTLEAVCGNHDWEGFVPLGAMGPATGRKGKFPIFGLGGGTGILLLSKIHYNALLTIFKSNPRR